MLPADFMMLPQETHRGALKGLLSRFLDSACWGSGVIPSPNYLHAGVPGFPLSIGFTIEGSLPRALDYSAIPRTGEPGNGGSKGRCPASWIPPAGAGGFEPPSGGSKGRCLTTWLRPTFVGAGFQKAEPYHLATPQIPCDPSLV